MGRDGGVGVMCDKKSIGEPPKETPPPKSSEELFKDYNKKHKLGTNNAILYDYFR